MLRATATPAATVCGILGVYSPSDFFPRFEDLFVELPELTAPVLIAAGAAILFVGLLLGWLMGRRTSAAGQKHREVERKLDQILQDKKIYEDEVVEHFADTAKLLNNLTQSYRDVHNHLANGAATLCPGEGPVALGRLDGARDAADISPNLDHIQPPLDYAPKTSPDEKGMLNEEFGMDKKPAAAAVEPTEKS